MISDYLSPVKRLCSDECGNPPVSLQEAITGSLSAGAVNVRVSVLTEYGETIPTPRVSLTVLKDAKVLVSIGRVSSARGYRVYASQGSDTETYQGDVAASSGGSASYTIAALSSGSALPTEDTASIHISTTNYEESIVAAAAELSSISPRKVLDTLQVAPNQSDYDLPADWVEGFSVLLGVSSQENGQIPEPLERNRDFYVVEERLWFRDQVFAEGDEVTLSYITPYTMSGELDDIPPELVEPFTLLAASHASGRIATKYSHKSNSGVGVEAMDAKQKSSDFRAVSREYRSKALEILGAKNGQKPTSGTARWRMWEYGS